MVRPDEKLLAEDCGRGLSMAGAPLESHLIARECASRAPAVAEEIQWSPLYTRQSVDFQDMKRFMLSI